MPLYSAQVTSKVKKKEAERRKLKTPLGFHQVLRLTTTKSHIRGVLIIRIDAMLAADVYRWKLLRKKVATTYMPN